MIGHDSVLKIAFAFVPDCGLWSCEHCSQVRADAWKLNAYYGASKLIENGRYLAFVTLTTRGGAGRTRKQSLAALARCWPKLHERARYWSDEIEYILIPEQHKNGVVHAHLLCTNILTQRWWKDNAYYAGLGYQSSVQEVEEPAYAPAYIAKYLGKDIHRIEWPRGFRRVRTSRHWPIVADFKAPDQFEYSVFRDLGAAQWELHLLGDLGYEVRISETAQNLFT